MHRLLAPEQKRRRRQRRFAALAWISRLFGIASCAFALLGVYDFAKSSAAMRWPTLPGVIVSNEVRSDTVGWMGGSTGGGPSALKADRFYVTYSYSVDDHPHAGSRIDVFMPIGKKYPRQYQARYPAGKAVEVHVNPKDATQAVLETPWPIGASIQAIGGLFLGVLLLRWSFSEPGAPRDAI